MKQPDDKYLFLRLKIIVLHYNRVLLQQKKANLVYLSSLLVNSIEFELKEDVEGYKTYSAVVENTTDINFEFINLEINLLDADGVIVESTNSNINNFNSGSKARFEFDTMEDFDSYDIVASWAEK